MPAPISSIEHRGTNSPSERSIPSLLFYVTMSALPLLAMRHAHVGSANVNTFPRATLRSLFTIGKCLFEVGHHF
jgi:hypothetical protein